MNVDCDNFQGSKALFAQHVVKAKFAAVDLEMTGIFPRDDADRIVNGDTPAARYSKQRKTVREYSILQVGICLFEESEDGYIARPFNFYAFPRPVGVSTDKGKVQRVENFQLDTSSIEFLRQNGMDFGRWISKGVTYVNKDCEEKLRAVYGMQESEKVELEEKRKPVELTKKEDIEWLKDTMAKIKTFVDEGKVKEMKLPKVNAFLVLALRLAVAEEFPQLEIDKRQVGQRAWEVERYAMNYSEEEKKERAEARKKEYAESFDEHLGLRAVWKALGEANIPIAIHNGYLDLLFVSQALGFELPETLDLFKDALKQEIKGTFFDTKLLADRNPKLLDCKSTNLGQLYEALQSKSDAPKITMPAPFDSYVQDTTRYHEAAYDALCTGALLAYFQKNTNVDVNEYANQVYMMRSLFSLNVKGIVDPLVRSNCIIRHVYDFDKSFRNNNFMEMLAPIMKKAPREDVSLSWIDDTSLLLLVPKNMESEVDDILKDRSTVLKFRPFDEEVCEHVAKKRKVE
eukprot:GEMP01024849.1.p1 GENE.GEMP01024849.1~~GEMP01024849.1.p1  ORF type:complete len:564 (-),score=114.72 GEMP01024849.1:747-2291(-)